MSQLPRWGTAELPEPLPFNTRNILHVIGPGAILLATSIGGGEWLVGPAMAAKYGAGIMWIATVGIILQVIFNLESIRYTLYTGEPIYSGIMRLRPGSTFWGTFFIVLTAAQLGVPALGKACATIIFTTFQGHLPEPADDPTLIYITYGVLIAGFLLLSCGGTIEKMLERLSWAMVAYIFTFLLFVNIAYVPVEHSAKTLRGFANFGYIPQGMDWVLLAALAATAGSGGIGNLTISNWVRDKGMGMGKHVGAIASAIGGQKIELSHTGVVFPVNEQNMSRWRTWWKYVVLDQAWLWGLGCFIGMYLNVNLASNIMDASLDLKGPAAGAFQAEYLAKNFWTGFWYLGLLNGFWILFSTHLGNTDILVRTITDIVWVASSRLRETRSVNAGRIYYALLIFFTLIGFVIVNMASAMELFIILASVASFVLVPASIQILIVNTTLLPVELRPPMWRRVALVLCAIFYGIVSGLAAYNEIVKRMG
jgi:hypothetical protein